MTTPDEWLITDMNKRQEELMATSEALQAGMATVDAKGIQGEVNTVSTVNPQAFVLSCPGMLSHGELAGFRQQWKESFTGTKYEGIPLVILLKGMTLSVVDQKDLPNEPT